MPNTERNEIVKVQGPTGSAFRPDPASCLNDLLERWCNSLDLSSPKPVQGRTLLAAVLEVDENDDSFFEHYATMVQMCSQIRQHIEEISARNGHIGDFAGCISRVEWLLLSAAQDEIPVTTARKLLEESRTGLLGLRFLGVYLMGNEQFGAETLNPEATAQSLKLLIEALVDSGRPEILRQLLMVRKDLERYPVFGSAPLRRSLDELESLIGDSSPPRVKEWIDLVRRHLPARLVSTGTDHPHGGDDH